jgi:hypothetical protein
MTAAAIATLAAQVDSRETEFEPWPWDDGANPDLWMYRTRTLGLLRRYMRLSVEVGRLPSVLGREFFRARVSSYHVSTFEDTVIFVHDMERTVGRLDPFSQKLIAKIVLPEYTQAETACLLGCSLRNIERFYVEALDRLSEEFLRGGLLRPIPGLTPVVPKKSCQEAKIDENFVSCCNEGKNIF